MRWHIADRSVGLVAAEFEVFLAASPCAACASSYVFQVGLLTLVYVVQRPRATGLL